MPDDAQPGALPTVLSDLRAEGFGVELWPAFYSLEPYRPAYHPVISLREKSEAARRRQEAGHPDVVGDLTSAQHRAGLREALGGMRSAWHSRLFDEKPVAYGDFSALRDEVSSALFHATHLMC